MVAEPLEMKKTKLWEKYQNASFKFQILKNFLITLCIFVNHANCDNRCSRRANLFWKREFIFEKGDPSPRANLSRKLITKTVPRWWVFNNVSVSNLPLCFKFSFTRFCTECFINPVRMTLSKGIFDWKCCCRSSQLFIVSLWSGIIMFVFIFSCFELVGNEILAL